MLYLLALVTVLAAVANARSLPNYYHYTSDPEDGGKLHLLTVTEERFEGVYYNEVGGIHFVSEPQYLYIATMGADEEPLLVGERPVGPVRLVRVLEKEFVEVNGDDERSGIEEFAVPIALSAEIKAAMESPGDAHKRLEEALKDLREANPDTHAEKSDAFARFLQRSEIFLIEQTAYKIGDMGFTGREYPAALTFLMAAKHIHTVRMDLEDGGNPEGSGALNQRSREESTISPSNREKRFFTSCGGEPCLLPLGCPDYDNDCHGMCGRGCDCWMWLCGDCCFWPGCHSHDNCCRSSGFWSFWRCWIPYDFNCLYYYGC